jgi:hypothetical protein
MATSESTIAAVIAAPIASAAVPVATSNGRSAEQHQHRHAATMAAASIELRPSSAQ